MKSKVTFDLSSHNNIPVIRANVVLTDDVRDKLARRFVEQFGANSNLAYIQFLPNNVGDGGTTIEIFPIDFTVPKAENKLTWLSKDQVEKSLEVLKTEIENRNTVDSLLK